MIMLKTLKDFNFFDKKVLVRTDFNVPIENGRIIDSFRIERTLPTINYLREKGAKVILLSHQGNGLSFQPVALKLEELLKKPIKFLNDCCGKKVEKEINKMKSGQIILLENLRFYPQEKENNLEFAKNLAKLGDIYVSEAFSVSHRSHASIVSLPFLLQAKAIGFLFEKEMETLSKVLGRAAARPACAARPLVIIIGGKKISSNLKVISSFIEKADHLLFGGELANVILRVKGICVGKPWPEKEMIEEIGKINLTDTKIHLPMDVIVSPDETGEIYIKETGPGKVRKEEEIFDIGPETIQTFSSIIKEAKTIIWSGPLGLIENKLFKKGTETIAQRIVANTSAFSIAGGGDTIKILRELNFIDKFSFISTGGSAMLSFLAEEKLPGIEALKV